MDIIRIVFVMQWLLLYVLISYIILVNNPSSAIGFNQQTQNLQQQIALNQLQKHALESLLLHEQFKENPFKLQFHRDSQTNTENITRTTNSCKWTIKGGISSNGIVHNSRFC